MEYIKIDNKIVECLMTHNIVTLKSILDSMLHSMLTLSKSMRGKKVRHEYDNYANLMFQMIFSKAIYFRRNIDTVRVQDGEDCLIYDDPAVILNLVRQLYEAICTFAIVFCIPNTPDKRMILYNIYVITGLRKRSNFNYEANPEAAKKKLSMDKEEIDSKIKEIENSDFFSQLNDKNKKQLRKYMEGYDFPPFVLSDDYEVSEKIKFENIPNFLNVKDIIIRDQYRYLCTHAHSSFYSLLQFSQWYELNGDERKAYEDIISTQTKFVCFMISVAVDEFIKRFPELLKIKMSFKEEERQILDLYNYVVRNKEH